MKTAGNQIMSEPGPLTAAGGIALYKLGAFGFFAVLAAVVVMAMTLPKTAREFAVAMISTLVVSLCGGAFVVRWFDIGHWASDTFGLMAIGGIIFACGLPGWLCVRSVFAWQNRNSSKTITDLIREIRGAIKGDA